MNRNQRRHTSALPQGRAVTPSATPKVPRASLDAVRQATPGSAPAPAFHSPKSKHSRRSSLLDGKLDPNDLSLEKREALVRPAAILALESLLEAGSVEEGETVNLTNEHEKKYRAFKGLKDAYLSDALFVSPAELADVDVFAAAIAEPTSSLRLLVDLCNINTFLYLVLSSAPPRNGRTSKQAKESLASLRQAALGFLPFIFPGRGQLHNGVLKMIILIKQQAFFALKEANFKSGQEQSDDAFWAVDFDEYANEQRTGNRQSAARFKTLQSAAHHQYTMTKGNWAELEESWAFDKAVQELIAFVNATAQKLRDELAATQAELSSADEAEEEAYGQEYTQETDGDVDHVQSLLVASSRTGATASTAARKKATESNRPVATDSEDEDDTVDTQQPTNAAALNELPDQDSSEEEQQHEESDATAEPEQPVKRGGGRPRKDAETTAANKSRVRIRPSTNTLERVEKGRTPKASKFNERQADAEREDWDTQGEPTPKKLTKAQKKALAEQQAQEEEDEQNVVDDMDVNDQEFGGGGEDEQDEASFVPEEVEEIDDVPESLPPKFSKTKKTPIKSNPSQSTQQKTATGFATPSERGTVPTPARPSGKSSRKPKRRAHTAEGDELDNEPTVSEVEREIEQAHAGSQAEDEDDHFDDANSDEDEDLQVAARASHKKRRQQQQKNKRKAPTPRRLATASVEDEEEVAYTSGSDGSPRKRKKPRKERAIDPEVAEEKERIAIQRRANPIESDPELDPTQKAPNYYRQNRNGVGNRIAWTAEEERVLIEGMRKHVRSSRLWGNIIAEHGIVGSVSQVLANRTNVSCKDKAVNLKKAYITRGQKVPSWLDDLTVPAGFREKQAAQDAARRAARAERERRRATGEASDSE